MKYVRRGDQEFLDQARAHHDELLAAHAKHLAQVQADNNAVKQQHHDYCVAMEDHHSRAMAAYEKIKIDQEEAHAHRVAKLNSGFKALTAAARKKLGMEAAPLPEPPADPIEPVKPEVPDPELIPEPEEPKFGHEIDTFSVREVKAAKVKKGDPPAEPWEMVETPWGLARAHVGSKVLTNDVTGEEHIESADSFERMFVRER